MAGSGTHLHRMFSRAARAHAPVSVLLEVNHRCHLDCVQCYLEDNHDQSTVKDQMTFEELVRLIDELAAAGCLFLTLSGGEIFLRKDTLAVARHARSRGMVVRLFTSGTLLSPALCAEMAELLPASVEITLYSMDAAVHDGITRSKGSHARTLEGIALCRQAGLPLTLKTPLMRENFAGYRAVRDFAIGIGASYLCDPNITPRHDGNLATTQHRLSPTELAQLYADRALEGSVISCSNEPPDPGGSPCSIARRSCVISPFGEVYPCMEVHERAGSVREQPFAEIWERSPVFTRLRGLSYRDFAVCGGCNKAEYCNRCNGVASKEEGDFFGPSTWACTNAAAKELAAGAPVGATSVAFVPLELLALSRRLPARSA